MPYIQSEDINARVRQIENTYEHEASIMRYIAQGNYEKALHEANFFINNSMAQRIDDILLSHRALLFSTNTLFRKAAQGVNVHPLYQDEISERFAIKLSVCTSREELNDVFSLMIKDYCTLCLEYSNRQYSENVQKTINYILFNLSSDLTKDKIAKSVNFSPSYISRKFKEEVGLSIITFIAQERVRIAEKLLTTTNMPIQDISAYVGIADWNYFTKIFKKNHR